MRYTALAVITHRMQSDSQKRTSTMSSPKHNASGGERTALDESALAGSPTPLQAAQSERGAQAPRSVLRGANSHTPPTPVFLLPGSSMPTKYVWWDDKRSDPPTRMQLRVPQSLHDFAHEIAKVHGISVNAFLVALLHWAFTQERGRTLHIDVGPTNVRVASGLPPGTASDLASEIPTHDRRFPYGKS